MESCFHQFFSISEFLPFCRKTYGDAETDVGCAGDGVVGFSARSGRFHARIEAHEVDCGERYEEHQRHGVPDA